MHLPGHLTLRDVCAQAAFSALAHTGLAPTLQEIFEFEEPTHSTSRDDLVIAIPTNDQHLPLVQASRHWRKVRELASWLYGSTTAPPHHM